MCHYRWHQSGVRGLLWPRSSYRASRPSISPNVSGLLQSDFAFNRILSDQHSPQSVPRREDHFFSRLEAGQDFDLVLNAMADEDISLFRTVWGQDVAGSVLTLIDSMNQRRNRQLRGRRVIQLKGDIGRHHWLKGRRVSVNGDQNRIDQDSVR